MHKVLLFLLLIFTNISFAQQAITYEALVTQTNDYLKAYNDLGSPYGITLYPLSEFDFTEEELTNIEYVDIDSIDLIDVLGIYQGRILSNVEMIFNHPNFNNSTLGSIAKYIVSSEDKMLQSFSIDEKTGGSYRSLMTVMYYKGFKEKKASVIHGYNESETNSFSLFYSDGYNAIHSIDTPKGTKYLLQGSVKTCGKCYYNYISLITFDGENFTKEFEYKVELRNWEDGITYDPEKKVISVKYITDDLMPICDCDIDREDLGEETTDYNEDAGFEEESLVAKKCSSTFKFNGSTFELTICDSEIIED